MRTPSFQKSRRGSEVSQVDTVPAPVKGLNAKDSLANMDPLFATKLTNYFPDTTDVGIRKGITDHVTGIGQQVESLMPYNAADGTQTLFAAANDSFYDVTSAGAVGGAVQGSLTNARWQSTNFTISDGTAYLLCFNGTDGPRYWDGSSWTTITGTSSPAITGSVTPANIISATTFARRVWLVEKDSLTVHYLPVDSVGGAANKFPLAGYFGKGGYITAMESWTLDGGEGSDDYLAIISSEGQVAVFRGTDPSSTSTFELTGIWNIGEPISRRSMIKIKGDCLLLTTAGVYSLSAALANPEGQASALSFNITDLFSKAARDYSANYGWEVKHFPAENQIIVNVPVREGSQQIQYVMNEISGAWCDFADIAVNCFAVLDKNMYCGGNGTVYRYWNTFADNTSAIDGDLKTAFNYLGNTRYKQLKAARPNIKSDGTPAIKMGVNADFRDEDVSGSLGAVAAITFGVWDTSLWDQASWSTGLQTIYNWETVLADGTAFAPRIKSTSKNIECRITSIDLMYEYGGIVN